MSTVCHNHHGQCFYELVWRLIYRTQRRNRTRFRWLMSRSFWL